jgi:hypothetical protein
MESLGARDSPGAAKTAGEGDPEREEEHHRDDAILEATHGPS